MRTFKFIPAWRGATEPVALVEAPDAAWFACRRHVRFTLLSDGTMLFGAGDTVLHRDICLYVDDVRGGTLMVGSFVRIEGVWIAYCLQYFAAHGRNGSGQDYDIRLARAILPRLDFWPNVIATMGNDPIADSTHERNERADNVPEEWQHGELSSSAGASSYPAHAAAKVRGIRRERTGD